MKHMRPVAFNEYVVLKSMREAIIKGFSSDDWYEKCNDDFEIDISSLNTLWDKAVKLMGSEEWKAYAYKAVKKVTCAFAFYLETFDEDEGLDSDQITETIENTLSIRWAEN